MPRVARTADVFAAVAEPRRRLMLELLARSPGLAVGALVAALGLPQPTVSKHLAVLRQAGIVTADKAGLQRLYRLNGEGLKPVYDWAKSFEPFWANQLTRIKARAEAKARSQPIPGKPQVPTEGTSKP